MEQAKQCAECGKEFKLEKVYKLHFERAHVEEGHGVTCNICGQEFKNKYQVNNHKSNATFSKLVRNV